VPGQQGHSPRWRWWQPPGYAPVEPPGVLKIEANNVGQLTHNVVVEGRQADGSGNPADQMGGVTTLHPGQAGASPKLHLDPGHYVLASTLSNQADLGMTAQLVVRARP